MTLLKVENKKIITFSVICFMYMLIAIIDIQVFDCFIPFYIIGPLFLVFLILINKIIFKVKLNTLFLLFEVFTLIGHFIQYYKPSLIYLATSFFILGFIFLIKITFSFITKLNKFEFTLYLILYLLLFGVIFFMVLDERADKLLFLYYTVPFIVWAVLAFVNFLKSMTNSNMFLFISSIVSAIGLFVFAINPNSILLDPSRFSLSIFMLFSSYYFMNLSFIYKSYEC